MLIGLTGSMAAGKSTVSRILKERGFCIIDADEIAHGILLDYVVKEQLCSSFGHEIIGEDGQICRRVLADRAFCSDEGVKLLNSITHPAVISKILIEANQMEQDNRYVVLDAPLLIESDLYKKCDCVWLVCANIETRYARIMERDGLSRNQACERVAAQMPQWKKKRYADIVIENDGDMAALRAAIDVAVDSLEIDKGKYRKD